MAGSVTLPLAGDETCRVATFHCFAATATRRSRAALATRRSCGVIVGVVRLPNVPASNGVSCRVGHDHADGLEGNAQLVGDGLRELGANVLADLDFAGEDGDAAVFADVQPCGDVVGELFAMEAAGWCRSFLSRAGIVC